MTQQTQTQTQPSPTNDEQSPAKGQQTGWQARWKALSPADRKKIIGLSAALVVGLVLMYMAGLWGEGTGGGTTVQSPEIQPQTPLITGSSGEEDLESKLTRILAAVEGAGEVSVALRYSESATAEYVLNTELSQSTSEETGEGGNVALSGQESASQTLAEIDSAPVLIKEIMPQVSGAVIVAEGAADPAVREQLHRAARTLLDLPAHRIEVLPAQREN